MVETTGSDPTVSGPGDMKSPPALGPQPKAEDLKPTEGGYTDKEPQTNGTVKERPNEQNGVSTTEEVSSTSASSPPTARPITRSCGGSIDRRVVPVNSDGSLPPEMEEEAMEDLHEKKQWVERDVQALRELVDAEPNLKSRIDQPFLLAFLRARKFDYEQAMEMIRRYHRARLENKELYVNLTPSALDHVWPLQMQTVLPFPDVNGRTVIIFRTGSWKPEECSLDDVFRAQVLILEHIVRIPVTQLKGIVAVVDCSGLSMTHAYYLTPTHARRMISIIQGCEQDEGMTCHPGGAKKRRRGVVNGSGEVFPLRFKALHFIHEPSIFDWIFSIVRPFLSEKINGRLHFHGEEISGLHEHIPADILPEELGGSQPPLDNSELISFLKQNETYYSDHFTYGYEEVEEEEARQPTMMDAVADVGSFLGSYYRRMCIE
ncbi:alpha-tocopherol transfer protein-like isoform X2 [Oratosquilla oratoria]|uniref:alpha-tocopherol transfer protein-like isoform X2 n=1 Tax=Oratosquilla oratoria TaxID=337810 RepID=UPI003F7583BB